MPKSDDQFLNTRKMTCKATWIHIQSNFTFHPVFG
uniref:Uncharacterized protein n=1 Tax=Tetranychus urticae TaxID=32264 RepID=T1KL10_TETUR